MILKVLAAGILWLLGEGFLLVPPAMAPLTEALPAWLTPVLGGLCVFLALSGGIAIFASARMRASRTVHFLLLGMLAVMASLFFLRRLPVEGLLIAGILTASLMGWTASRREPHLPTLPLALTNALIGLLLLLEIARPWLSAYASVQAFRQPLGAAFIFSAILSAIPILRPGGGSAWSWGRILTLPWLAWLILLLPTIRLPHLLPPAALIFVVLMADPIPWEKFILPDGDRVGRRLVLVESMSLLVMVGLLAALLGLIDHSFATAGISGAGLLIRHWVFIIFNLLTALGIYGTAMIALTVNGLMSSQTGELPTRSRWSERIERYIQPFSRTREGLEARLAAQTGQLDALTDLVGFEKHKSQQLSLLSELSQQLETQLDQPVAAQLTATTLASAIENSFVGIYMVESGGQGFRPLATSGWIRNKPVNELEQGGVKRLLERVLRLRKSQVVNDLRLDPEFSKDPEAAMHLPLSFIAVPLIYTGNVKGVIGIQSETADAFSSGDLVLAENMAAELVRAWERSGYHHRLMQLIQAGISLSTMVEPGSTVKEMADIARRTLEARFTYIQVSFGGEAETTHIAQSGFAPRLVKSLEEGPGGSALLLAGANAVQPFRVRDLRKYASRLDLDNSGLRSLLVIPIRLHDRNIGAILAFGKETETVFTENDEALANLLASQAAAAIESVWLQQELRTSLRTTRLLYELSYQVIQAEGLSAAAGQIATVARRLTHADSAGIVLFKPDGSVQSRLVVDHSGMRESLDHPVEIIGNVMSSGRTIYEDLHNDATRVCLPIQTPMGKYGALWLDLPGGDGRRSGSPADLQTLTNQAALALERAMLLVESRQQAEDIRQAFTELELGYDHTLASLISALDARDKETEGHSLRVGQLTGHLGVALGLDTDHVKALQRGALLHDIGKIGVSDLILNKSGPLNDNEWPLMQRHPDIGARIIDNIPFLESALPVVRYHHERWDGSGYPKGLRGDQIPLLARIFAVVDVFDALTSDRPYRERIPPKEALDYLRSQAGTLFDPHVVEEFERLLTGDAVQEILKGWSSCEKPFRS